MKKPLICIIGRTGTGKSTIARWMCEKYGLKQVRSYATRPMRPGEEKVSDHIFIKPEDVEKYRSEMAAYTRIGQYELFTTVAMLDQCDVYVIDPFGVGSLRKKIKDRPIYEIYVSVDQATTKKYLKARADTKEDSAARMKNEKKQFDAYEALCSWDFLITNNGTFEEAQQQVEQIMQAIIGNGPVHENDAIDREGDKHEDTYVDRR